MSLLIQWNFPEYENENIMPTSSNAQVLVDTSQLEKAIKKISILTRDINNFISVSGWESKLMLSSWDTDMGNADTHAPAIIQWEMSGFGINGKYVSDFLRSSEWDEIEMRVVSSEKPIIFKDKEDDQFTYVVRPLIK